MEDNTFPAAGLAEVVLEGLPQVRARIRAHTDCDLRLGVAQAFGFRSTADFELLRPLGPEGRAGTHVEVRVLSRLMLDEVAGLARLFRELPDFESEVAYSQLSETAGVPLLRLHRAMGPACGAAVASWFEAYREELEQLCGLRDLELRAAASLRVWRTLRARVDASFPGLAAALQSRVQGPSSPESSAEERLIHCTRLFSAILDEVRLRILPLRMQRTISSSTWDVSRLRLKRLLRVFLATDSRREGEAAPVFLVTLHVSSSGSGAQANPGFTGHELYYQVSRFFGLPHVQVRTRDGALVSLEKPHEPLLGQLASAADGICVDLEASAYEPQPGSFDQLYREVLRILGPRHFKLDQSYRLQMPGGEEMLTTTQGNAIISTVILIPVNFLGGKQMYLFRSPRYRQCKAAMRTFEEFKEMLHALVQVFGMLTNQMTPAQAERIRGAVGEGAPGQTPLAPFEGRGRSCPSRGWNLMHGCTTQAHRCAMGVLGGLQTAPTQEVGGALPPFGWSHKDMMLEPGNILNMYDALQDYHDIVGVANLLGVHFSGKTAAREARRVLDQYGIETMQADPALWWQGVYRAKPPDRPSADPWTDPWSIAVGGLVGVVFGLLEGVYCRVSDKSVCGKKSAHILERMAQRGALGVGVSALFHILGRLLRLCLPDGKYAALSRKSIPASQAVVFLGTAVWAVCSHHQWVEPSVVRRLWRQDLNLAERQAAGIILISGIACSFSVGGYLLGAHVLGGTIGGPAGAFAGSLMPLFVSLVLTGLDWWQDRARRRQMKAAALQTLGLPDPSELGVEVFRPMLATRYKLLACYLHPDKNDVRRSDTTTVFSQIRLAKEILEQELKDYQNCPRERLRKLFEHMVALCGVRRDCYVSEHPSGVIMNILEDGVVEAELEDPSFSPRLSINSITTTESRSLSASPPGTPRSLGRLTSGGDMATDPAAPGRQSAPAPLAVPTVATRRIGADEDTSPALSAPASTAGEPWVLVAGAAGGQSDSSQA